MKRTGSGLVSWNENNGINELELGAREIWLRIRKKQQTRRKSACRYSRETGQCLRELQVPATAESRPQGAERGGEAGEARPLQAVHAM